MPCNHKGWQRQFPFVYYIEKFELFQVLGFHRIQRDHTGVHSRAQYVKSSGEHTYGGRFAPWSHFRRVIDTLDSFWD